MPLRAPRKLPKRFRRPASSLTRSLARQYLGNNSRRARRRKEWIVRWQRRATRFSEVVASEFRLWLIVGAGVIVIAIISILLFAPFFDVREMNIRRQDARIDPEEIQGILSPLFKQRLVLVTKNQIAAMLQPEFPDIERIEMSKQYPSRLNVTIYLEPVVAAVKIEEAATPISDIGSGSTLISSGATVYSYVTKRGYFVTSPIRLSSSPLPTIMLTDWGIRPQNRTFLLSPLLLQTIFLARDTLRRDFGLSNETITVFLRAQEFHIRTNKTVLWFDLKSPLAVQFQRFREFLKYASFDQAKSYIDLRIADKIIYQ